MAKLYDLAVKVGTYPGRDGQPKAKWKNIGSIVETKDGGKVILIDRTFNPAGVPCEPDRDSIMISMFAPKEQGTSAPERAPAAQPAAKPAPSGNSGFADMDDDIPF